MMRLKLFLFTILMATGFAIFSMEQPKAETIPGKVYMTNDTDYIEYKQAIKTLQLDYIIICTAHITGRFAGQIVCFSVDKILGGGRIGNDWYNILQQRYLLQQAALEKKKAHQDSNHQFQSLEDFQSINK